MPDNIVYYFLFVLFCLTLMLMGGSADLNFNPSYYMEAFALPYPPQKDGLYNFKGIKGGAPQKTFFRNFRYFEVFCF